MEKAGHTASLNLSDKQKRIASAVDIAKLKEKALRGHEGIGCTFVYDRDGLSMPAFSSGSMCRFGGPLEEAGPGPGRGGSNNKRTAVEEPAGAGAIEEGSGESGEKYATPKGKAIEVGKCVKAIDDVTSTLNTAKARWTDSWNRVASALQLAAEDSQCLEDKHIFEQLSDILKVKEQVARIMLLDEIPAGEVIGKLQTQLASLTQTQLRYSKRNTYRTYNLRFANMMPHPIPPIRHTNRRRKSFRPDALVPLGLARVTEPPGSLRHQGG